MDSKVRAVLALSLILNLVLSVALFVSMGSGREAEPTPTLVADLVSGATPSPIVLVVTATFSTGASAPTSVPTPFSTLPPTPTPEPTALPTQAPEATLEPTPEPTPEPGPVASPTLVPGPDWLRYSNLFRLQADLPQLVENPAWSEGSRLHSVYMVKTDQLWHGEDPGNPWFNQAGHDAAENGNISASDWFGKPEPTWAVDYWISAPFHALALLDPRLQEVGYGSYREELGTFVVAANMDIKRGQADIPDSVVYPVLFPKDGGQTWVLKHGLPEFPDPLTSCPSYQRPTGPPIMVQLGSGDGVPAVSSSSLRSGDQELEHCLFDETSYTNPTHQDTGRQILDKRDALVIIPRSPLEVGKSYTVTLVVNGETISWSFEVVSPPG